MRIAMIGTGYVGLGFRPPGHLRGQGRRQDRWLSSRIRIWVATFTRLRPGKANSPGASAVQNNNHCLQQDVNVEPDGPVSNIEEILRLLSLQIAVAPRGDLPHAGDAGLNADTNDAKLVI